MTRMIININKNKSVFGLFTSLFIMLYLYVNKVVPGLDRVTFCLTSQPMKEPNTELKSNEKMTVTTTLTQHNYNE